MTDPTALKPAFTLRDAVEADAPALLEIYRPFVESSNVSFEEECPSVAREQGGVEGASYTATR